MAVHDLRKHVAWYLKGFPVGGGTRKSFMECESIEDVQRNIDALDSSLKLPEQVLDTPRGRVRFAKKVHLPYGWLDSRITTSEERKELFGNDPLDASYQSFLMFSRAQRLLTTTFKLLLNAPNFCW